MEYSSSRVCRCGGTSAPRGKPCSTTANAPPVSAPNSLKSTVIEPRSPLRPSPGRTTVNGGGSGPGMSPECTESHLGTSRFTPGSVETEPPAPDDVELVGGEPAHPLALVVL